MISGSNINFKGRICVYEGSKEISSLDTSKNKDFDEKMLEFVEDKFLKSPDVKLGKNFNGNDCLQVDNFTLTDGVRHKPALAVDLKLNGNSSDTKTSIRWEMLNFEKCPELIDKLLKKADKKMNELIEQKKQQQLQPERASEIFMDAIRYFSPNKPNF